jgi:hypothetical protein
MSEQMNVEQELALMDQLERAIPPERKLRNDLETHINMSDLLLQAVLDVAEVGLVKASAEGCASGERFDAIRELVETYRGRNENFIQSLYRKTGKAA